jgi:uncharacterized protein YecE (DUF72 family)
MVNKGDIYIGTSGWHYKHWVGPFYPSDIKESDMLAYFQQYFSTVEINNSFYNLPLAKTFTHWKDTVGDDFVFAIKASRYITHMKKLNVEKSSLNKFFTRIKKLERKAGPVLFQLPPKWNVNTERLETFLTMLPASYRYTFEFRNDTWQTEEVFDILKKHKAALCIYELAGNMSPIEVTANFVYMRLHGPGAKYQGCYSAAVLKKWAAQIKNGNEKELMFTVILIMIR